MRNSYVKKSMRNEICYEKLFPHMKHSRIHDTSGTPMNIKDENVKSASDSLSHEKKHLFQIEQIVISFVAMKNIEKVSVLK